MRQVAGSQPQSASLAKRPWQQTTVFSRMRREGFPFIVWGSGGWTRVRVVCAVGSRARRGVVVNCVPWGWAPGVSRRWRRAVAIAGQGVVWVAPCFWDCWGVHGTSCDIMSCHIMSPHVTCCPVTSCHVVSCLLTSFHVVSCCGHALLTRVVDNSC